MSELPEALTRSETKGKLLKHLQMDEETYALLAVSACRFPICALWPMRFGSGIGAHVRLTDLEKKEADVIYKQLVGNPKNLKPSRANVKPPYDWNDICERSRHEAVHKLAEGTNSFTAYWWQVGSRKLRENDLPWLPVFILYKVIRSTRLDGGVACLQVFQTFRHRDGRAKSRHHGSPPQYAASTSELPVL